MGSWKEDILSHLDAAIATGERTTRKLHRCDMEDGTRCEFHTRTSPPDCDDFCSIMRHGICNWYIYRDTYPKGCPFRMEDGSALKLIIDRKLGHINKKPRLQWSYD